MLEEGQSAPDFKLVDTRGKTVSLSDFKGKFVVVYFYPKDFTPGCTTEACNLRDNYDTLTKHGIIVLGISTDSVDSHIRFSEKHALPFQILSDGDGKVSRDYGVLMEKIIFGKKLMGIKRTTFVVDPKGKIKKIIKKVNNGDHSKQILDAISE